MLFFTAGVVERKTTPFENRMLCVATRRPVYSNITRDTMFRMVSFGGVNARNRDRLCSICSIPQAELLGLLKLSVHGHDEIGKRCVADTTDNHRLAGTVQQKRNAV